MCAKYVVPGSLTLIKKLYFKRFHEYNIPTYSRVGCSPFSPAFSSLST